MRTGLKTHDRQRCKQTGFQEIVLAPRVHFLDKKKSELVSTTHMDLDASFVTITRAQKGTQPD